MFQYQKTLPTGRQANKANNDLEIGAIPVHTMQQDLDEAKNPGAVRIKNPEREPAVRRNPINPDNLNATQKSSPFLNPIPETETGKPEAAKTEPINPESARVISSLESQPPLTPKKPLETAPKAPPPASRKPLFLLVATSLILILIASGGYYFWMTRQQETTEVVEDIPLIEPTPEPAPEPTPEPVRPETFATDKPNYLNADLSNAETIKNDLESYADKVTESGITTPVEFVVTDKQNNPILFSDFASKIGISFNKPLMDNLKETFSLFVYKDVNLTRFGLSIDSQDATNLKTIMAAEEKTLVKELEPIFLSSNYTLAIKSFNSSSYRNLAIRYINITSPEDLSIDYAVSSNHGKLLVGTTKMTLRSIIDYTDGITATIQGANIVPKTEPRID